MGSACPGGVYNSCLAEWKCVEDTSSEWMMDLCTGKCESHLISPCIDSVRQDRRFGVGLHWFWYSGPNMSSRYESYALINGSMPHISRNKRFMQLVFVTYQKRTPRTESLCISGSQITTIGNYMETPGRWFLSPVSIAMTASVQECSCVMCRGLTSFPITFHWSDLKYSIRFWFLICERSIHLA